MYRYAKSLFILFSLYGFNRATAQQLEGRKVLAQKVEILIPSDFKQMDMNTILVKYPGEGNRPTEVYTNNNNSVNLVFTHTSIKSTTSDIRKYADELVNVLKQKGVNVIDQEQKKINNRDFFIVAFYSKALNGAIYNKMFFTVLEGTLLIGSFNCTSLMEAIYKSQADKIIKSIKIQ
jgi:hypothetical protein